MLLGSGTRRFPHEVLPFQIKYRLQFPAGYSCSTACIKTTRTSKLEMQCDSFCSSIRLFIHEPCISLFRFTACWTSVTGATFTILVVHPTWSKHPVSSVGTQSIWFLLTWTFWIASAGVLNGAIPRLFNKNACQHLIYCGHIQALLGKSSLPFYHTSRVTEAVYEQHF